MKGATFLAYVEQSLVPTLKPGDFVIMGNLASHKGQAVCAAIRKADAKLFHARRAHRQMFRGSGQFAP